MPKITQEAEEIGSYGAVKKYDARKKFYKMLEKE
jgi:hypothetical protein